MDAKKGVEQRGGKWVGCRVPESGEGTRHSPKAGKSWALGRSLSVQQSSLSYHMAYL